MKIMIESISVIYSFLLGLFAVMIIDSAWWHINFKKIEKGMEAHEHYHISLELLIISMFVYYFTDYMELFSFLIGAAIMFFAAEWAQGVEVVNRKVQAGHRFAYGSKHFRTSSIIGVNLLGIIIFLYLYLPTIL